MRSEGSCSFTFGDRWQFWHFGQFFDPVLSVLVHGKVFFATSPLPPFLCVSKVFDRRSVELHNPRKFCNNSRPDSVSTLSGWNCTPSIGKRR